MQDLALEEIIGAAIIVPVVSLIAVWAARKVGRWVLRSMERSFAQVVLDVMAPDMAHLSTKVTSSLDELRNTNNSDHHEVQSRLGGVEGRLAEVEARLASVESRLGVRPSDARTRVTDKEI